MHRSEIKRAKREWYSYSINVFTCSSLLVFASRSASSSTALRSDKYLLNKTSLCSCLTDLYLGSFRKLSFTYSRFKQTMNLHNIETQAYCTPKYFVWLVQNYFQKFHFLSIIWPQHWNFIYIKRGRSLCYLKHISWFVITPPNFLICGFEINKSQPAVECTYPGPTGINCNISFFLKHASKTSCSSSTRCFSLFFSSFLQWKDSANKTNCLWTFW